MNELALFAGAGGGILGGELLGWRCVCAVEIDPYAASVLAARQNDGLLAPFPIWDDVCVLMDGHRKGLLTWFRRVFRVRTSVRRKGGWHRWGAQWTMVRSSADCGEVRPRYVFVENSPMLLVRGLDRVLGDLAAWGMAVDGECWELPMGSAASKGSIVDCGRRLRLLWVQRVASSTEQCSGRPEFDWRTFSADDMADAPFPLAWVYERAAGAGKNETYMSERELFGQLNPVWVKWLIGCPLG